MAGRHAVFRRLGVSVVGIGFILLLLPCAIGRPPIGQAEANRHRQFLMALIVGGAALAVAGAVTVYRLDRFETRPPDSDET